MESRKMVLMNVFGRQQWRHRRGDTDVENRLMDMEGQGKVRVG